MSFNFENLDVYKRAINFVNEIYLLTRTFPKDEMFGLVSQLRRAAVSVSLNISEGSSRTKKEFARFIDMARGSIFECFTILEISLEQNYIDKKKFVDLRDKLTNLSKMMSGLKRSLNR